MAEKCILDNSHRESGERLAGDQRPATAEPKRLTPNETLVLKFLADEYGADGGFHSFAGIGSETSLDRRTVRLACRSLKRKGFARFAIGLWTEDGEMRGAGYAATEDGCARAEGI